MSIAIDFGAFVKVGSTVSLLDSFIYIFLIMGMFVEHRSYISHYQSTSDTQILSRLYN